MPPLRERCEDILPLLTHYIQDANRRFGYQVERFTADALVHLLRYSWPGNVRELKNLVEASFIDLPTPHMTRIDLPERFLRQCQTAKSPSTTLSAVASRMVSRGGENHPAPAGRMRYD